MNFEPDEKIQQIASAYAQDACEFLSKHFRITLDGSDASIQQIETVLETFHRQAQQAKPSPEQIMGFAKIFGSYIGEVFRKNHGAVWGLIEMDGQKFPELKTNASGTGFWPWGRVQNRLVAGADNNVWDYYQTLVRQNSG